MNSLPSMPILFYTLMMLAACNNPSSNSTATSHSKAETSAAVGFDDPRLAKIKLPPGFKIEIYAADLPNARSMELSPSGVLFVGTRDAGNVYAVKDTSGDFRTDHKWTIATGLKMPNGVALKDGDLYVAEVSRILKYPSIEKNLDNPQKEIFFDQYPDKEHHGWKFIDFGPDGHLYVPVGAPCNICESEDEVFATITRINMNTKSREIVHHGIRNTVGFAWHPETKEMWFTDNGGDWLGEDMPECELNYAPNEGMHFGFPYCHQGDFLDPKLGKNKDCADYSGPAEKLGAHVAPLGLDFNTGSMFPAEFSNQLFIAEHGSWNKTIPSGYRIVLVKIEENKVVSHTVFAEGWLDGGAAWGRPVDIEFLPDGSMLVSDDYANVIYRISYSGKD
jgi:glucose/arabinose dehydrogenase